MLTILAGMNQTCTQDDQIQLEVVESGYSYDPKTQIVVKLIEEDECACGDEHHSVRLTIKQARDLQVKLSRMLDFAKAVQA